MIDLPPQNIELEQGLLSACLFGGFDDVSDQIKPSHFYRTGHGKIFEAMLKTAHNGKVDAGTLISELPKDQASTIKSLLDFPSATNIDHSCRKLKTFYALRQTVTACHEIIQECSQASGDDQDVIDRAQSKIMSIEVRGGKDSYQRIDDILTDCLEHWESIKKRGHGISGVTSGYVDIDRITAGFQNTDLIILAARPSMGKTALAMNMATNGARAGFPVGFFSLEMGGKQLSSRMVARQSKVNSKRFLSCNFSQDDWNKVTHGATNLAGLPIYIDDTPALHHMEIRRRARKMVKNHGIRMMFVDYLQLAKGDRGLTREQEVSSISAALKGMAKEFEIPVIALSQLNRKLEERKDKRPILSDLRDSGSIEQDADVVMFIYRDEHYNEKTRFKGRAEILFEKNRMGETGRVWLHWLPDFAAFENIARE